MRYRITPLGRRAVLTPSQQRALAERVDVDGRQQRGVPWQTARALAALRLVEFRDGDGVVHPDDGDNGVDGPRFTPFRTDLGAAAAAA